MTLHTMTVEDKIDEVTAMIRECEYAGAFERAEVLKAIAADLVARQAHKPSAVLTDIDRRVCVVKASHHKHGYSPHALHGLGEGTAKHWPTIRQALERFGAEVDG